MSIRNLCLSILAGAALLSSCTEQIDLELDSSFIRLVVDGGVTNQRGNHMIRLTTTTDYFYTQEPPAVKGARILLQSKERDILLAEFENLPGYYLLPEPYKGIPGSNYTLKIELKEAIGGSVNYSAEAYMPETDFRLDSIRIEYNDRFDFWLVSVYAQDPPSTDYYKFDTYVNAAEGQDAISRTVATPDRFFNGQNTNGFNIAFFDGKQIKPGDTITTVMSALSADYFNFISELRNESGFNNPLFSGPPANVRSNLNPGGLGYFYARKVQETQRIVGERVR